MRILLGFIGIAILLLVLLGPPYPVYFPIVQRAEGTPTLIPYPDTPTPVPIKTSTPVPNSPVVWLHKSGIMCLGGPGGEYPVIHFFLPDYLYPYNYDPTGVNTVNYWYDVIEKYYNYNFGNQDGWWWRIDIDCWVKHIDYPIGTQDYARALTISGDFSGVPDTSAITPTP